MLWSCCVPGERKHLGRSTKYYSPLDFTAISFTVSFTFGICLASLPASAFCAGVFTLPLRVSVPFFALQETLCLSRFLCAFSIALQLSSIPLSRSESTDFAW